MKNILLFCFTLLCTLGVQAGDLICLLYTSDAADEL